MNLMDQNLKNLINLHIFQIFDINKNNKDMRINNNECKERIARIRANKDAFIKACSSNSFENQDEDLKVTNVSPIKSLFCNMNLDNDGTEYDSPLPRRRSKNSEFLDLDAKFDKPPYISEF